jgi:uncharacterized protein (DUF302 family)
MFKRMIISIGLLCLASCAVQPNNSELIYFYQVETTKPYADVLAELEIAIAEHNFRITGHSRVGKVIRDRGANDYPEYDTIQFCNLTLAKTILDISPHAIGYMPCNIITYQFDGKTIIKTHLLPDSTNNPAMNDFSKEMNLQLKQIVDFAAQP